ncbi:MAG: rane-flanked domain protein [Frankiales bacterium]|nr:rane-flanked domain protein [Frankiales bacterium]
MSYLHPSPKLSRVRLAELATVAGPLLVAALVVGLLDGAAVAVAAVLVVLTTAALVAAGMHRRVRSWGYLERADDLIVARGVLVRRVTVVPYGRMQFLDVTAGPYERAFGLATVQLHTAAAASDARIPGLEKAEADRLRDRLAALGEARAAGL